MPLEWVTSPEAATVPINPSVSIYANIPSRKITPQRQNNNRQSVPIECHDYFLSPEARKHYGNLYPTCDKDKTKSVLDIMKDRIQRLYHAAHSVDGWRDVLEDGDFNDKCTSYHIHQIKCRSLFLSEALTIFVTKKIQNEQIDLKAACKQAGEKIKSQREAVVQLIENNDDYTNIDIPGEQTI